MFMKTKIFLSVLCFIVATSAMSQVSIGIQGGGVYSTTKIDGEIQLGQTLKTKSLLGWQAGVIADIPFGEGALRLIPEINYVKKGFKLDASGSFLGQPISITGTSFINYLELPVNLAFTVPSGDNFFVFGGGPYAAYGLSGKNKGSYTLSDIKTEEESDIEFGNNEEERKPFDYGLNFMAGYLMGNGAMLKFNYSLGLANISNNEQTTYKNSYFGLTLGYFIKKAGE
jgi:hypothetical protein